MLTEQRNPAEVSPTAPAQAPQENAPPDSAAIARSCLENLGNGDAMPFKEVAYGSPEPPPYVVIAVPVNTLYIDGETRTADDVLCYVTSAYVGLSGRIGRQPTPTEAIDRVSFLAPYDAPNDKARPAGWWVVHRSSGGSAYLWSAATNGHIGRARPSPDGRYLALQYWGVFDDKQTSSEFIDIVDLPALIREKRYVLRNPRIGPAAYNILGWDGADLRFDSSILLATYPSSTRHPRLLAPEVFRWKSSARDIEPESPALRDPVAYYCNGLLDTAGKEGLQLWMRRDLSRQGLNAFKSTPPPPACREKAAFAQ
jgi:hypothetical protein